MAASVPNAEVLERLLIEVVGDDSGLRQVLDEAVASARQAAQAMRDALAVDLSKLQREAEGVTQSFNTAGAGLGDLSRQFQQQLGVMQAAFDKVRDAGDKSVQEFEAYRRAALEALEAFRPMATAAFGSAEAFEALVQHVRTATYEQRQQRDETEKSRQSEEDLAETIKRLTNEVKGSRNVWAGRIASDEEFRESTTRTRAELVELLKTVERGSDEYRKITQELAYAQRGLDSVNREASRGGLAWTAQIALANQFGQTLRGLGPAGGAAATALGFVGAAFGSLQAPLTMADFHLTKVLASLSRFAFIVAPMAAGLGAIAGAAGLGALTLSAAKAARELENATHRTGLTIEGLQELQHAARSTGIPLELLSTTMQRLQRRAADANAGNAGLAQAFRALGVTLTDSEGKMRSTEDLLGQVADGLNRVENNADRLALAFKIFDTEGGRLLPLLAEGSEGIKRLREEARELGLVISGDTVLSLAEFQSQVETVKRQFEVLKIEVGAAFLPLMRDVFIPLLQDAVIPWLQNAAQAVDNFSDAFFDTTEAGVAFRRDTVQNLNAVISLGRGVVAAANAVAVAVNSIFSVTASIGSYIGNITTLGMDSRTRQGLRESLERLKELRDRAQALGDTAGVERFNSQIEATNALLGEMGSNWFTGIFRSGEDALRYAEGVLSAFDNMVGAFTFDVEGFVEGIAGGVDRNRVRQALAPVGDGISDAIGDSVASGTREALEGSLKYAQEQLSRAQEELAFAVGAEARAAAKVVVDAWQEAVNLIQAELAAFDPAQAAKVWTERLAAEVRFGLKDASEAFDLVNPRLEELREEAAQALAEFGFDSTQFQDTVAKLEVLEAFVKSIRTEAEAAAVSLAIEPTVTLPEPRQLTAPAFAVVDTEGLRSLNAVRREIAEIQALIDAAPTLDMRLELIADRDQLQAELDAMLRQVTPVDLTITPTVEMPDAVDLTITPTVTLLPSLLQAALAEQRAAYQQAQEAMTEEALREAGIRLAAADAEVERLTKLYRGVELPEPPLDAASAFDAWAESIRNVGVTIDPVGQAFAELNVMFAAGQIGAAKYAEGIQLVAAAQERLAAIEGAREVERFAQAFEAWREQVQGIGRETDPVASALQQLNQWLDEGRVSAEEYADALELVAAAQERLDLQQQAREAEKAVEAWKAARRELDDLLGNTPSQFDELREAAQAAFDAGIIGADELAKALQVIGILEVADGFRQVAAELGEVAGIVPNLAADLTEAFAMFTAGNTAGGIATAFQAATAAVRGLGAAFEDEARRGEAALDLIIGGAAAIATALGGPAMGQAVAAAGEFIKSILGDLTNGLAEIDKQVRETASRSQWLGEGLVRGIAEGATRQVSRGGLLGLLGFTKAALDEDAFRAGISIAEGLANGMVNTLRSGDFEEAWQSFIDDVIVNGIIEAFIATALVQDAIQEAMELIQAGRSQEAAASLDQLREQFRMVWETIQGITNSMPDPEDIERSVTFSLPSATVSVLAAPQWALELQTASERMSAAGESMLTAADLMVDAFTRPLQVEVPQARGVDAARSL